MIQMLFRVFILVYLPLNTIEMGGAWSKAERMRDLFVFLASRFPIVDPLALLCEEKVILLFIYWEQEEDGGHKDNDYHIYSMAINKITK